MPEPADDDDLPGDDTPFPEVAEPAKPKRGRSKKADAATSPPPPPPSEPPPPPLVAAEKRKVSPKLRRLAENYGVPTDVIDGSDPDDLADLVAEYQMMLAAQQQAQAKPAEKSAEPAKKKPSRLPADTYLDEAAAKVINEQADMIEELQARLGKLDELEKREADREKLEADRARAQHIEWLDAGVAALGEAWHSLVGAGSFDQIEKPQQEARAMLVRAAGILNSDRGATIAQKIAAAAKTFYPNGPPGAAPPPPEKKMPGLAEEWASGILSVPAQRNGSPEVAKKGPRAVIDSENDFRRRVGLPIVPVPDEEDEDEDLPD